MVIKPATDLDEFLQIHHLNYKTFVEEIPQNQPNVEKKLIDKFHLKNQYVIAKRSENVIGMVCYNFRRPFSLDEKINDLDRHLPRHTKLAEIRLLSICKSERKNMVAYRLLQYLSTLLIQQGTDAAVISGTTHQLKLYTTMGFIPFGCLVGSANALYQPMYITLKDVRYDFKND